MPSDALTSLAGGFLSSFTEARQAKDARESEDKLRKLQMQLIEQQVASGNVKLDAQTRVVDLLTGSPQTQAPPDPMAARNAMLTGQEPPAASPQSPGLTDLLSNPELLSAASQAGMLPDIQSLSELQAKGNFANLSRGQGDERTALGIEAGFSPAQLAGTDPLETAQLVSQIALNQARLQDLITERENADKDRIEADASQANKVQFTLDSLERFDELNSILEGTQLESGLPFPEVRAVFSGVQRLYNIMANRPDAVSQNDRLREAAGELEKEVNAIGRSLVDALEGTVSVTRLNQIAGSLMSGDMPPGANRAVVASLIGETLSNADALGLSVGDVGKFEALRDTLRAGRVSLDEFNQGDPTIGDQISSGLGSVQDAASNFAGATQERLGTAADAAQSFGGGVMEAAKPVAQELIQRVSGEIESFRGKVPDDIVDKAKQFAAEGTQEGIRRAGVLVEQAQEIMSMGRDQLLLLDRSQMTEEMLRLAAEQWERVNQ